MAVLVYKTAPSIMLCAVQLRQAINDDVGISPSCEEITVTDEVDLTIQFVSAITTAEDLALDNLINNFTCPPGSGATPPTGTEIDAGAGLIVRKDGTPLVVDVAAMNFSGAIAATDDGNSQATIHVGAVEVVNNTGVTIPSGTAVYVIEHDLILNKAVIGIADNATPSKMPAIGITTQTLAAGDVGLVVISGEARGVDTSSWPVGTSLYIGSNGALTSVKPVGNANQIQKIGQVAISDAAIGTIFVIGAGRANDIPNLADGKIWVGTTNDVPAQQTLNVSPAAGQLVPVGNVAIVDAFDVNFVQAAKWFVTVVNATTGLTSAVEIYVTHRNGSSPTHNISSRIGDNVNYTVDVVLNGTQIELQITNTESVDAVHISATQLIVNIT